MKMYYMLKHNLYWKFVYTDLQKQFARRLVGKNNKKYITYKELIDNIN